MALELLAQLFTFESSTKSTQISFDSDYFFRIAKRSIADIVLHNLSMQLSQRKKNWKKLHFIINHTLSGIVLYERYTLSTVCLSCWNVRKHLRF